MTDIMMERQTNLDIQRDKQTPIKKDIYPGIPISEQTDIDTDGETSCHPHFQTLRHSEGHQDILTKRHLDIHIYRYISRQITRQLARHTSKQTE